MSPAASSLDFYGSSSGDRGAAAFTSSSSPSSSSPPPPQHQQQQQQPQTTPTATSSSSMMMPPERSVARPVSNLGSTCYMNAVLQALAHAPELCLAMDCHPHHASCPKAAQSRSPVSGTRKSLRQASGRKSPPESSNTGTTPSTTTLERNGDEFCTLCEVERHILQVHDTTNAAAFASSIANVNVNNTNAANNNNNTNPSPVVPSTFVNGFIDQVAPWFQLGVQEDSHEFLRLLIDAMQKSCVQARSNKKNNSISISNNETNPQGDDQSPAQDEDKDDPEYPFQLFRGSVESRVVCAHCKAISSTLDPIEDIGLEVTAPPGTALYASKSASGRSASRNPSPTPAPVLEDVQSAFRRFAREEPLDAQYKCEQCGKFGRATKQSRLARLPPILTLHLKRFRYGDRPSTNTSTRRSARTSEVGQLLMTGDNGYSNDFYSGGTSFGGKTGSAKIEGHVKFGTVIDLKPYLTDALQKKGLNALCRLFAVIVHSGKNSHTGHYIAYVCNMSNKNEWWKMDDARVTKVSEQEVLQAEAYMLFYRAMSHAVKTQLDIEMERRRRQQEQQQQLNKRSRCFAASDELLDDGWNRRKANFPPHLIGLIDKVSEMMAEEVPLTRAALQEIEKEAAAAAAAGGKLRSSPRRRKITEADVVGGTEKYRSVLLEIFYRLKDDPNAALFLASASGGKSIVVESSSSHNTNENNQQQSARVSVEEPVEDNTLL